MKRRSFLRLAGLSVPLLAAGCAGKRHARGTTHELSAEVAIIGGGLGGCAAALAACRAGLRVVLTEETDWIGGQLTSQAVPPDEHPWIEEFGCTRSYRGFRDGVRAHYRDRFPLTEAARANPRLNPGNAWVSRLCHEPRVALAVLEGMLAPFVADGRLRILRGHIPVAADVAGDRVRAVTLLDRSENRHVTLTAPYFVDATELGDLLPLTGTEHVIGAESRADTGEPHAPATADPMAQQAFTCCFPIEHRLGEDHTIPRPAEYAFWRDYIPALRPPWSGRLLDWQNPEPKTLKPRNLMFDPTLQAKGTNLWTYRRILDAAQFKPGAFPGDVSLVNWPQNDYWLGPLVGVSAAEAAQHIARAKQLSLSLLYWMQTEAPRPDGGTGWKGLRLRPDLVGTADGLAKSPYIREARRIRAEFTVTELHVGTDARMVSTGRPRAEVKAADFPDSVGIGAYRIDLHPDTAGTNYVDLSSVPFQVLLGALLPLRLENLLPACKNLGVTHLTNGCYRLHPVEWNIGESVGWLVAESLRTKEPPRQIRRDPRRLGDFQRLLLENGVELAWPNETRPL